MPNHPRTSTSLPLLAVLLACVAALACSAWALEPARDLQGPFPVDRVIDGDTFMVILDGRSESVRLIGIDTPETVDPRTGVQPFGPEASEFARRLLSGREVWLERDVELRDRYDRLLAYAYVTDPSGSWEHGGRTYRQINLAIAMSGFADQLTIPPNVQYADLYQVAIATARTHGVGMWSESAAGTRSSGAASAGSVGSGDRAANRTDAPSTAGAPASPGAVQIECIFFDPDTDQDFGAEEVILVTAEEVDVRGWVLHDEAGHRFSLPSTTLAAGESLTIENPGNAVWNNGGDTATLLDATGAVMDQLTYDGRGTRACR